MCRGLFHRIKHIIRWPLREEISAYVIQLRSKAVFKLGWPPGLWKQEIILKAQRKIPAGFCLSPSTFLLSSPAPAALAAPALAALLALEALWKRQSVISATRARECGSQPSQSLGGKKKTTHNHHYTQQKGTLQKKLENWTNGPEAATECWGHQTLPPRRPRCAAAILAAVGDVHWPSSLAPWPKTSGMSSNNPAGI